MADAPTVRVGGPEDVDACMAVLRSAYHRDKFGLDWFSWKHLECPWGPSRMYIAEDDENGILGVVFGLPWPFRVNGVQIDGARFVDGGTLEAARGKRVLGILAADELAQWAPDGHQGVLLATATPAAEKSHLRNGATSLPPIVSTYGVPRSLRPAKLTVGDEVIDSYTPVDSPRFETAWSPEALRWRTDARSERVYEVAALANADAPNGLIYRIGSNRGVRTMCPVLSWGSDADRARLIGAVAIASRAPLVVAPIGDSVTPSFTRSLRPSGTSVMCVWDRTDTTAAGRSATEGPSWQMSMADLEGLI